MSALIMHVDMDAFFASVEQQANPALRGKPVIIGGRDNKYHSIICAASYEAKALGIKNAMFSQEALRICPQAIFVPADTAKYVYTSNQIFAILKSYTPQVEKFSVDEFFLDITGSVGLFGSVENLAQDLKRRIRQAFGISCSVGVAPTKLSAKLMAKLKKPDGLLIADRAQVLEILQDLPIEKICGIGPRLKKRFHQLGILTCGQLAQYPDDILDDHFGVTGLWLKAICQVQDHSAVEYFEEKNTLPKSVGHSQTLREVTSDQPYIRSWIYLLAEMVAQRLRQKGLQGRTIYFYASDGFEGGYAKRKTFHEPTYDGQEIYQRCLEIIRLLGQASLTVRVLGVSVSNLSAADSYYLFEEQNKRDRVLKAVDQINHRFGDWTVVPAALKAAVY